MESVGTNLIEFINIYNYLENKPELKKMCLDKIIDYYFLEYIDKKPCPFKDKDNRCMIYEVRPLNCRLFGHWKKEDYNKLGIILSIVNAFIISSTGVLCTMIDMDKIWQLLYGFVLLVALIYVFYGIIGNILESIYKRRK